MSSCERLWFERVYWLLALHRNLMWWWVVTGAIVINSRCCWWLLRVGFMAGQRQAHSIAVQL